MISRNEVKQIAQFFGDFDPKISLLTTSKISIGEKTTIVFCQSNRLASDYRIEFWIETRHEILTELINQKFNR